MKKKKIKVVILLLVIFAGILRVNAQKTEKDSEKRSCGKWLIETPWTVGFGGSIIRDNGKRDIIPGPFFEYTDYPAIFTADKNLKLKGWSMQFAFSSTSFRPHSFGAVDLNFKYDFNNLIGETKWFDPYSTLGFGLTFRDASAGNPEYEKFTQPTFNAGLGVNLWLTKIMALNLQGQAKFAENPLLVANIGLVFKINPVKKAPVLKPKSQEAKDALQHIRGIINK